MFAESGGPLGKDSLEGEASGKAQGRDGLGGEGGQRPGGCPFLPGPRLALVLEQQRTGLREGSASPPGASDVGKGGGLDLA